ncbi:MAG: RES family NAD+ phosphorylase [Paludibacteraceae bacterium]|nr:RES family NAD+ phosphorylase [Paludibacteraceae bacterium]
MIRTADFKSEELRASLFVEDVLDPELACDFFQGLFEPYVEDATGVPLALQIMSDWDLFIDNDTANRVIEDVLSWASMADVNMHADTRVVYSESVNASLIEWTNLKQSIKCNSRFLSDLTPLENLGLRKSLLNSEESFNINNRKQFYRARIANLKDEKYTPKDMGAPPAKDASAGRANPEGIPYLYLCTEPETCYYEVRAAYLDRVWIGRFSVESDEILHLINLEPRHRSQQLTLDSEPIFILRNRLLMNAISKDLSTPLRRHDKDTLEYLPTQFICEYIRLKLQKDGIIFQSSLKKNSANVVLFNANKVKCREVREYEVTGIDIHSEQVN